VGRGRRDALCALAGGRALPPPRATRPARPRPGAATPRPRRALLQRPSAAARFAAAAAAGPLPRRAPRDAVRATHLPHQPGADAQHRADGDFPQQVEPASQRVRHRRRAADARTARLAARAPRRRRALGTPRAAAAVVGSYSTTPLRSGRPRPRSGRLKPSTGTICSRPAPGAPSPT
jgi:hypothetical protein